MNRYGKVKLFRTLKVVFYCLGLPLFFLSTLWISSTMFLNNVPFAAKASSQMFAAITVPLNSSALYGVWVALGVWAVLAVVQLILHFAVKGRKTRMFAMVAVTLVVMLVPIFVIDTVFSNKIDNIAANAPSGVVVNSYEYELGHYRTMSSDAGTASGRIVNETDKLIKRVNQVLDAYHIGYYDTLKDGLAGNTTNVPVTYRDLGITQTDDYGNDISDLIITLAPTGAEMKKGVAVEGTGYLEVKGVRYDDYFFALSQADGKVWYRWYSKSKMPEYREGVYGLASYNKNGLLSDGYIYSLEVALNILNDYYTSQEELNALFANGSVDIYTEVDEFSDVKTTVSDLASARAALTTRGNNFWTDYYQQDEENRKLLVSEMAKAPNFSLTEEELDQLVDMLGGAIGGNALIDMISEMLGADLIKMFNDGTKLFDLIKAVIGKLSGLGVNVDENTMNTINGVIDKMGFGNTLLYINHETYADGTGDLVIELKQIKDADGNDLPGQFQNNPWKLYFGPEDYDENDPNKYPHVLDSVDNLVNAILGSLKGLIGIDIMGLLPTILGLVGVDIPIVNGKLSIKTFLLDLVGSLYWYQSPLIRPYFDFYTTGLAENQGAYKVAKAVEKYERALYEGSKHGFFIGSSLIESDGLLGGGIGTGDYTAAQGLTDAASVRQLQTDLSYKPTMYPLLSVRDMLMVFAGIVILFTILSYYASEKEIEWATGKAEKRKKKKRRDKRKDNVDEASAEDTALKVSENTDKEVF